MIYIYGKLLSMYLVLVMLSNIKADLEGRGCRHCQLHPVYPILPPKRLMKAFLAGHIIKNDDTLGQATASEMICGRILSTFGTAIEQWP